MVGNHGSKRELEHESIRDGVSGLGSGTPLHPCRVTLEQTHNKGHVSPQQKCMWASAVRLCLAFSGFSLILLTFRRRQRSPERLQPNIETVNAALTSVPPLSEQHRTVEDLKAIVGGWRIKRAMKLKCFGEMMWGYKVISPGRRSG